MELKDWIDYTKKREQTGIDYSQQVLETYIEESLGLTVEKVTSKQGLMDKEYEIEAKDTEKQYLFEGKFYAFDAYKSYERVLILKEVKGKEGIYRCSEHCWLKHENKQTKKIIRTPLTELLNGEHENRDLKTIVERLRKELGTLANYKYSLKVDNDLQSFQIEIGDRIVITAAFSNSLQINYKDSYFTINTLIYKDRYKDKLEEEIKKLVNHIKNYLNKDIRLAGHNLKDILQFIDENKVTVDVNSGAFVGTKDEQGESRVFNAVIGKFDGYRQMKVSLDYHSNFDTFYLHVDYLLKNFIYKCETTSEVLAKLDECNKLLNPEEQDKIKPTV